MRSPGHVDDRAATEIARDSLGVHRCRHDDDPEIVAGKPGLPGQGNAQVGVDAPLVKLVENDRGESREQRVLLKPGGEYSLCRDQHARVWHELPLEPDVPAGLASRSPALLVRDPARDASRSHAPRLQENDRAIGRKRGRHTRRLAGARSGGDDSGARLPDARHDFADEGIYRERDHLPIMSRVSLLSQRTDGFRRAADSAFRHVSVVSMLETVFLDAGGVLIYPNWTRISAALAAHGVPVNPAALAEAEPHAKRKLDVSKTINATNDAGRGWLYFNLILAQAGIPITPATDAALADVHAYHKESNLWELMPSYVLPSLAALKSRGLRLTVVSNANGRLCSLLDRIGLTSSFDCILDSHEHGVEKPDPRFFELALERSGARRETTIHVGDLYEVDVMGARHAGLRGVLLDEAGLYEDADCPRVRSLPELVEPDFRRPLRLTNPVESAAWAGGGQSP